METKRAQILLALFVLFWAGCEGQFLTNIGPSASAPTCEDTAGCELRHCQVASCSGSCEWTAITACLSGDGCCPSGCTGDQDEDCNSVCGNGQVESGETCDGDCPTACDDGDACTTLQLQGAAATCNAQCVTESQVTACVGGDGCCPTGCTADEDIDCSATCGNSTVEPGEICDGNCPTACDDGDACTVEVLQGSAGNCDAECAVSETISACVNEDGCCPAACNESNDSDCSAMCGNAVVETGETCDGNCPTACDDGNSCTVNALQGAAASCDAMCVVSSTITACVNGDGCCPSACNNTNDNDCVLDCMDLDAWPSNWASFEDEVIVHVNERRAQPQNCGIYGDFPAVGTVSMGDNMRKAARCHSQDMGTRNRLGHDGSNGSSFSQRLGTAGYTGQPRGENVAAGQTSPLAVVNGWMNSDGHCRNIMNAGINRMGIGYFFIQNSTYRHWWTMKTGIGGN